ncbi:MAG: imidazole glycerol phosphate synthase subunit HisH [Clostridia bacterium]|nr:imidazole glycerol phosphate synthase subunit HisH [Clostridia bacterium]
MIAIVDYGVGNLFSIARSLEYIGCECRLTSDADEIYKAEKVLLPGVGAFGDAMKKLSLTGLDLPLKERAAGGGIIMGICLGMQLLFDISYEYGRHEGLGLIPGEVVPLEVDLKVPQIGWNALDVHKKEHPLMKNVNDGDYVYYVHSYYAACDEKYIVATSEYGIDVPGVVGRDNVMGAQFHPEKSGSVGLGILKAFAEI